MPKKLKLSREPVVWSQAIAAIVNALWLVLFSEQLDPETSGAIALVVQAVAGIVARQFVSPNE